MKDRRHQLPSLPEPSKMQGLTSIWRSLFLPGASESPSSPSSSEVWEGEEDSSFEEFEAPNPPKRLRLSQTENTFSPDMPTEDVSLR